MWTPPPRTENLKLTASKSKSRPDLQRAARNKRDSWLPPVSWAFIYLHTGDCRSLSRYMIISVFLRVLSGFQVRNKAIVGDKASCWWQGKSCRTLTWVRQVWPNVVFYCWPKPPPLQTYTQRSLFWLTFRGFIQTSNYNFDDVNRK